MSSLRLGDLLEFSKLLNNFSSIERVCYNPEKERRENDTEHSYRLAMLAWYIAENIDSELDRGLLLKYALIHDLVEVYAGDTFLFSQDKNHHDSKKEREELARLRIQKEFPMFLDLHKSIENYEKREDKESRFIYVLDKIHPVLQLYLDNGRMWKEKNVTLSMLFEKKRDKISLSEELRPLWNEIERELILKEAFLFGIK